MCDGFYYKIVTEQRLFIFLIVQDSVWYVRPSQINFLKTSDNRTFKIELVNKVYSLIII